MRTYAKLRARKHPLSGFLHETTGMNVSEVGDYLAEQAPTLEDRLGGRLGISFHDLKGRHPNININATRPGWSASTIKVPVMIAVCKEIDKGNLSWQEKLEVNHEFTLEHSDYISQVRDGTPIPVFDLVYHMIIGSDNEATNILANYVGLDEVNKAIRATGATRTMFAHLLAPGFPRLTAKWNPDGSNLTTAKDMTKILTAIYTGTAAKQESCDYMKAFLEESAIKTLDKYLPVRAKVANKIGMISDAGSADIHDVGVINDDYVLSVMCNKVEAPSFPSAIQRAVKKAKPKGADEDSKESLMLQMAEDDRVLRLVMARMHYEKSIFPTEMIGIVSRLIHDAYYPEKKSESIYPPARMSRAMYTPGKKEIVLNYKGDEE